MGQKRPASEAWKGDRGHRAKERRTKAPQSKTPVAKETLIVSPRPDWYAAELPEVILPKSMQQIPPRVVEELYEYAAALLETDNTTYDSSNASSSSSHKFMFTIMASGTLEDKISALTLQIQESPLHSTKAFENLLGIARKKSRNQALMSVAALKDLLGQGNVLPGDRKLRAFGKQPGVVAALQGKGLNWKRGDALPGGIRKAHLIVWAFEDWLKKQFFELLKVLEGWCSDEVEYARSRAITYVWELLKDKPEQEENLLRLLVNKLGDTDRKIASRTSYLLLQLQVSHPAMKTIVINAIEAECLFRPGQSAHAKYYAIITLNQTILGKADQSVANQLLRIYFSLFIQFLKPQEVGKEIAKVNSKGHIQNGGGKPGKMAAKKAKSQAQSTTAEEELREKMVAQVLSGVNRAFPFAETDDPTFEKQMDTIFRVTHSANFNTSIQALMLIQRISSTKHFSAERFYRTLYESLLDPRLLTSSKQIMYLNLLYRSLKSDLNAKRVQAFVKRLLQIMTMHEPPFVCGVLYLISELEVTFPSLRNMIKEPEVELEDEEERFIDAPEDGDAIPGVDPKPLVVNGHRPTATYDARKRDPEHSNADRSALWDLLPFVAHFHPSVSLFADSLLHANTMPPKPDPSMHSLMHFLDRFIYRNAKSKTVMRGSSIMQPLSGSNAADLLIKTRDDSRSQLPLNSDTFWKKNVAEVAADEVFFHSYFNQTNKTRPTKKKAKADAKNDSDDGDDDADEDEIWKALVDSKPDVEGLGDDDDELDFDDLEADYSGSDVDVGEFAEDGEDDDGEGGEAVEIADFPDEEEGDATAELVDDMDGLPDLDSGDDALLDDEDEVPIDFEDMDGVDEVANDKEKGGKTKDTKKKKKLKQLPTFASAEDYAKMLDDEPDEY